MLPFFSSNNLKNSTEEAETGAKIIARLSCDLVAEILQREQWSMESAYPTSNIFFFFNGNIKHLWPFKKKKKKKFTI